MCLETLKDVKEIGGFNVIHGKPAGMEWEEYDEIRKEYPIGITHDENMISFRLQNGPIKEVGVNGCTVDTVIEAAKMIIEGLNENFPCEENECALMCLGYALGWLKDRKINREKRGVEGLNQK